MRTVCGTVFGSIFVVFTTIGALAAPCQVEVGSRVQFAASFVSGTPVWPRGEEKAMNGFFRFRCRFDSRGQTSAVLRATAGYSYKAWLNGEFAAFGPARATQGFFRVDEWPLSLREGLNVVEIDVAGYNCNNFYLPDQMPFLQAEILIDGKVVAATAKDGGFEAFQTGRVRKVPRFSYQRGFTEVYRLPADGGEPLPLAEQKPKKLLDREWAYPDFHVVDGFAARSLENVECDSGAEISPARYIVPRQDGYKCFAVGELEDDPYHFVKRLRVAGRGEPPKSAGGYYRISDGEGVVFEGRREDAGFPILSVECDGPVSIYFTFDEILRPDGSVDNFRTETIGTLVWHLGRGSYVLEGFEPIAFKCARILAVGGSAKVSAPRVRTYQSPSAARSAIRASDPAVEKIFDAAKASYSINAVDCLTDCPIRERAGWLGDSFFTGRASQWLTGSGINERLFLENFQMAEEFPSQPVFRGLVPAVWPVDLMTTDCFIPNYDMWMILELEEYVARSGDRGLAERFRPRVQGVLSWFERYLNSDGLLERLPGWVFVEWSHANSLTQDVSYPSNMMYAKMLDACSRLYGMTNLAEQAKQVRDTVRRQSRLPGGWYCDNAKRRPDGSLGLSGECTEICQYYAFFSGVATKSGDADLWKILVEDFGPNRVKEGKWRNIWPANFIFGTCLRLELLSRDNRPAQIYDEIRDYFLFMAEKTGTLWEHNTPSASCCHGFASIAAEYLFRDILGVRRVDQTGKCIWIDPPSDLPLDWCEGTVPVSDTETIFAIWKKDGGKISLDVRLPAGWRYERKWSGDGVFRPAAHKSRYNARPEQTLQHGGTSAAARMHGEKRDILKFGMAFCRKNLVVCKE